MEKTGYEGKFTNKGSQAIAPLHKQPSGGSSQKKRGNDLRAGKGKK